MSSSNSISSSSFTSKRHRSSEPPPVTYIDDKTPSSRLNRAIQSSNINLTRRLLNTSLNPDGTLIDPKNLDPVTRKTSLILATEIGNFEMCKMLIEEFNVESDTISRDLDNNTVIHLAAAEGMDDIISLYHSHYPSVLDWANSKGLTALHVASQKGHESTVSLLLDLQADVELTDNEGNTSLHYAAGWGHLKIVLLLIDRGSPFWAKNNHTFTASDYAFSFSIQSALQESARAHFESKKSHLRQQQRQQKDRDKERNQRNNTLPNQPRTGSPSSSSMRTNRLRLKESLSSAPRSSSMPQVITTPPHPKLLNSPTHSSTSHLTHTPLTMSGLSHPSHSLTKPLPSPTSSITTARTVSHLISKDLVAIEDFRTHSGTLVNINGTAQFSGGGGHSQTSESGTISSINNRLLPLQLVPGSNTASTSPTLRSRSSTGNLNSNPTDNNRNRAGSTDSDAGISGLGHQEGLSRLRYLKNGNHHHHHGHQNSNPSSLGNRPIHLILESVPGSPHGFKKSDRNKAPDDEAAETDKDSKRLNGHGLMHDEDEMDKND
ncbi:hypothetical protein O181_008083 [Austropuccinia psidii MF-1]|uniref:Uncharacterized protein n=1 Tax=Austropuccinia psidii MF-1 TaxID=1389203 RepID=A0A9Q3GI70_9BASI|nr:hypothetical protein [Austropuccinia psidii MF-1]